MLFNPRVWTSKAFVWACIILSAVPILLFWHRDAIGDFSVPYARPRPQITPQFVASGDSKCLPEVPQQLFEEAVHKHAICRKHSPFVTGKARVATVTAHFGEPQEHWQKAFRTHLLHSLIHGTEVRVLCNAIVDDLWNKPAFILDLLMQEMMKPANKRLEWIQWVDRDTLILDQCRPITNFLPPDRPRFESWWERDQTQQDNSTNLLVNNDLNGLNNGVFLLRVGHWAIELFTAILAFRHYKPEVELPFTEQSAMEHVLNTPQFKEQTRFVPQHWFNAYENGGPLLFEEREDAEGMEENQARRGDYLVHFAGNTDKRTAIEEWTTMLDRLDDVWERGNVLRDVTGEIETFWLGLGFKR